MRFSCEEARANDSARVPDNLFFAISADANPAISGVVTFFFDPGARRTANFYVERGEGCAGAGDVVVPRRLVAFQVQAVPFAHGFWQPGHGNRASLALVGLA